MGKQLSSLHEADLALLCEAASEFVAVRTPVKGYVARRYAGASYEERDRHVARVTQRVERMHRIMEKLLLLNEQQRCGHGYWHETHDCPVCPKGVA